MSSSFTLEEYKIQREYRQNKRKEYLKRFELLKVKIPISQNNTIQNISTAKNQSSLLGQKKVTQHTLPKTNKVSPKKVKAAEQSQHSQDEQQLALLKQENIRLQKQLEQIEAQQRQKLQSFKQQISTIKQKYMNEIKTISAESQQAKSQTQAKMKKIMEQLSGALKKNEQIKKVNEEMKKQFDSTSSTINEYASEIKKQYEKKLSEFENIFNTSNEKIIEMQKEFNEQEFVQNALNNEELLKTIQENAKKSQEATQILADYKQLLDGKSEILKQINANVQMKQSQLSKMNELEGKMKIIFQKMNEEKKIYVLENQRMTKELMEIKQLIMGFLSQAENAKSE